MFAIENIKFSSLFLWFGGQGWARLFTDYSSKVLFLAPSFVLFTGKILKSAANSWGAAAALERREGTLCEHNQGTCVKSPEHGRISRIDLG